MRHKAIWFASLVFIFLPLFSAGAQDPSSRLIPFTLSTSLPPLAGSFEIKRTGVPDGVKLSITQGGNVGIGRLYPDRLLSVNGDASKVGGGAWTIFSDERLKTVRGAFNPGLKEVFGGGDPKQPRLPDAQQ